MAERRKLAFSSWQLCEVYERGKNGNQEETENEILSGNDKRRTFSRKSIA